MAVNPSPFGPRPQFELASGQPAVGNQLFFYVAGSVNTKQNTYTDSTGLTTNSNPIVLNSLGMPPNDIWFTAGLRYKVVYAPSTDTDPPTSPIWTIDNLSGQNDTTTAIDQWEASGVAPTFIGATTFTVPGDQTAEFHIGRRLRFSVAAGTVYGTIVLSAFGAVTTVTMLMDGSQALDAGLSAVDLSILLATVSAVPWVTLSDNGAALGPQLIVQRVSASPAAADVLGSLQFWGRDSAAANTIYSQVYGKIADPTDASEDGQIAVSTLVAGTQAERVIVGGGIYTPSATGGDQGVGTINLSAGLFINGARAPDVAASKADQETSTSTTTAVTPGRQQYHPSAAKAWCFWDSDGVYVTGATYNISSITDPAAVGQTIVNFSVSFSSANYCVVGMTFGDGTAASCLLQELGTRTTSGVTLQSMVSNTSTAIARNINHMVCFGDQ